MVLSNLTDLAVRVLTSLGEKGGQASAAEIAARMHLSDEAAMRVATTLQAGGLLCETAEAGGYRLCIPADEISLAAVVHLMDGHRVGRACGETQIAAQIMAGALEKITIADLVRALHLTGSAPDSAGEEGSRL